MNRVSLAEVEERLQQNEVELRDVRREASNLESAKSECEERIVVLTKRMEEFQRDSETLAEVMRRMYIFDLADLAVRIALSLKKSDDQLRYKELSSKI